MNAAGGRPRPGLWERIARVLFALFPHSYRERHSAPRQALTEQLLESEPDPGRRSRLARGVAFDALRTLPLAWLRGSVSAARDWTHAGTEIRRVRYSDDDLDRPSFSLLDWKLGFRMLIKYPGLSLVSGLALATVIGVGASFFHFARIELFPDLGFEEGDRIVALDRYNRGTRSSTPISARELTEWRNLGLTNLMEISAFRTVRRTLQGTAAADRFAIRDPIDIAEITASAFPLTRVQPLIGRALTEADERPGSPDVIVLGYRVWQTLFGGDPQIIGQEVQLGRSRFAVVGVMPEGFAFPATHEVWLPLRLETIGPGDPAGRSFARLTPGATLESAQAELSAIGMYTDPGNASPAGGDPALSGPRVLGYLGPDSGVDDLFQYLPIGLVLFGCLAAVAGNVATLMFARTAMREQEIVVRNALGASRGRIIGQLFIEALVLASISGVIGLVVANAVIEYVWALPYIGLDLPFWRRRTFEAETVVFTAGVAVVGAALVALLPAIKVTGRGLQDALKSAGAGASQLRFGGIWTAIIVFQVAITVVTLPFGVEYARDVWRNHQSRRAFPGERYLTFEMGVEPDDQVLAGDIEYEEQLASVYQEMARRLVSDRGVEDITFGTNFPGTRYGSTAYQMATDGGVPPDSVRSDPTTAADAMVDVRYFEVFDLPIVAGRGFNAGDIEAPNLPVIINEAFAYRLGGTAVGLRIRPAGRRPRLGFNMAAIATERDEDRWLEVVGVVRNLGTDVFGPGARGVAALPATRWSGFMSDNPLRGVEPEAPTVFYPASPRTAVPLKVSVKTRDPRALVPRVRAVAAQVDPGIRLYELMPLDQQIFVKEYRDFLGLLSMGGVTLLCLLLSAAGLFAVMAVAVARRTREVGIRVALGATRSRVLRALFGRAALQLGAGIAVGCLFFVILIASMGALTGFVLRPIGVVSLSMLFVGLIACAVPAARALRIKPVKALRDG